MAEQCVISQSIWEEQIDDNDEQHRCNAILGGLYKGDESLEDDHIINYTKKRYQRNQEVFSDDDEVPLIRKLSYKEK